jgi:lipopolysaccharide transport system ATP-binding protein
MGRELTGRRHGSVHTEVRGPKSEGRGPISGGPTTHDPRPTTNDPGLRPKEFWAVHDVNFELRRGECLGLIGRNGAGKTTLLKMLNGLIKPDAGRIEMRGRVGALIALGAGFNPILTGRENIYTNASVLGLSKKETDAKLDEIIDFAEIGEFIDTPVQNYSSGMSVRLGFAVASSIRPDILLIDEVLAVGDISFVLRCLNRISDILPTTAIVFVSHSMQFVSRICTSALLMNHGQTEYSGDDVSKAIELYSKTALTFKQQSVGGAEISLASIGLRSNPDDDYDYANSLNLGNGCPLDVRLEFESNADVPLDFNPWVKILDSQMREIVDLAPFQQAPLFRIEARGRRVIHLHADALHLNSGKHSLAVGANDSQMKRNYARINNCAEFYAHSGLHGWAGCVMPGHWSQEN